MPNNNTQLEFVRQNRVRIMQQLTHTLDRYGYTQFELPTIQPADLFLTRAGDVIIDRLFTFERNGAFLALRPEFTSSAIKAYVEQSVAHLRPARWSFSGSVFEDVYNGERATYETFSIGAELFGLEGIGAEAEIIALAAHGCMECGIAQWKLKIGNVKLLRQILAQYQLDPRTERVILTNVHHLSEGKTGRERIETALGQLMADSLLDEENLPYANNENIEINTQQMLDVLLDATDRGSIMGGRTQRDITRRLMQKRERRARRTEINKVLDDLESLAAIEGSPQYIFDKLLSNPNMLPENGRVTLHEWQAMTNLLIAYGIPESQIVIAPGLMRNWDYYSGTIFELYSDDALHLAGGGRYDGLARLIGSNQDVPAVGFVYYVDNLAKLLPVQELSSKSFVLDCAL
jgi:histidyl-tRNA synthetase